MEWRSPTFDKYQEKWDKFEKKEPVFKEVKPRRKYSDGWNSSSTEDSYGAKVQSPKSAEEVMWTMVRRVAPGWRHLSSDLYLLNAFDEKENAEVITCTVSLLKALGHRLLPSHARDIRRSRPEVSELATLLATLAVRDHRVPQEHTKMEGLDNAAAPSSHVDAVEECDPLMRVDPWKTSNIQKAKALEEEFNKKISQLEQSMETSQEKKAREDAAKKREAAARMEEERKKAEAAKEAARVAAQKTREEASREVERLRKEASVKENHQHPDQDRAVENTEPQKEPTNGTTTNKAAPSSKLVPAASGSDTTITAKIKAAADAEI